MVTSSKRRSLPYINFSCSDGVTESDRWIDILLMTEPSVTYFQLIIASFIHRTLGLLLTTRTPSSLSTSSNPISFRICYSSTVLRSVYRVLSFFLVVLRPLRMCISFSATVLRGGYP